MGIFWGAVAVNDGAHWTIYESPYAAGHFGLAVTRGLLTVVLNQYATAWNRRPNNLRHRLLRREYDKYFGQTTKRS